MIMFMVWFYLRARGGADVKSQVFHSMGKTSPGIVSPLKKAFDDRIEDEIIRLHFIKESIRSLLLKNSSLRSMLCIARSSEATQSISEFLTIGSSVNSGLMLLKVLQQENTILTKLADASCDKFRYLLQDTEPTSINHSVISTGHWREKVGSSPSPFKMHLNNFQKWKQMADSSPVNEIERHTNLSFEQVRSSNEMILADIDVDISFDQVYATPELEPVVKNLMQNRFTI